MNSLFVRIAMSIAVAAIALYFGGAYILVLVAPVCGVLLVSPIFNAVTSLLTHAKATAFGDWNGNYYSYEGQQLRIYEHNKDLWIVDSDLFRAIALPLDNKVRHNLQISYPNYGKIPKTNQQGFRLQEAQKFLEKMGTVHAPDILKFRVWFEKNVVAPHNRSK